MTELPVSKSAASAEEPPKPISWRARAIALYLPQFHTIPQNDEWWGPGFTEWTNVARARPLFPGHSQPHLPADLGFYDLRVPEVREQQAALARANGIEAFCYWHYWFGDGRRILERPFQEVLSSGVPKFSFCLGWANESWTGIWHGAADKVLIEQRYPGPEDSAAHFRTLLSAFRDERYLRVHGRPIFYVYRPGALPSASQFVDYWQALAKAAGLPDLYFVAGLGHGYDHFIEDGFDAGFHQRLPYAEKRGLQLVTRIRRKLLKHPLVRRYSEEPPQQSPDPNHARVQPCVIPNWDNTPRSGRNGVVLTGATPDRFRAHVRSAVATLAARPPEERLLWVKSWNEWAEGNYLEPDWEVGHARLRVLKEELQ
ncbi:glycoside hydrolase family 99-like domain-containing protein [Intrasporangium sp. DVR]|uniref:glycosyltransferase WbsX family protein n=1 Tax=Intrasporangium sp. DVR TaxID=3127867 RepID=UPI00313A6C15